MHVTIPALVLIIGVTTFYFDQRYSFRRVPLILVHALGGSFLLFIVTSMLDIFYYPQFIPSAEGRFNLEVLLLTGILSTVLLGAFFYNPVFGQMTKYFSAVIMVSGSFLLGVTLASLTANSATSPFLYSTIMEGEWLIDFQPLYLILLFGQCLFIVFTIIWALKHLNSYPINLRTNSYFEVTSSLAILTVVGSLVYDETISQPLSITIFVTGLVLMLVSVFFLVSNILRHPLSSIYIRNTSDGLFSHNLIHFVLYSNTDTGPTVVTRSNGLVDHSPINEAEIFKFGVTTLMMAYNENKYIENVSLTPFAARDDFFALSVSFITKDRSLRDQRFKNRTQSALVLLVPTDIVVIFSKPLRNISKINEMIRSHEFSTKDISEINDEELLLSMSKKIINSVF